jgi:fumarate hydratase class II
MNEHEGRRVERDSLGEVAVPEQVLYGAQTQRAVDNFAISGLKPWLAFIWGLAAVKWAAAGVHLQLGLLDPQRAQAITQAAQEVMDGRWADQFVVDPFQAGAGTSHNMNLNEVIANRATILMGGKAGDYLVHPNDHVNMSQSTNDGIPTAIRLDELTGVISDLAGALQAKADDFDEVVKSGRTHLQDAVPVRLGQEFSGYARAVERDGERVLRSAQGLRRLGIGATAAGTGLNAPAGYAERMAGRLSELIGSELTASDNLFESTQSMADMLDFSSAMRTLAVTLIRIANDLRLLSSGPTTGLNEIHLPAVQPGSSIMPGKVNPVLAEMLDMAMFHVIGCDTTVVLASQAGQLELNVMMPVIAHNLFEMMQVMIGSIRAFTDRCVKGIQANRQQAEEWLKRNPIVATALNPLIGYNAGAALVKEAQARGLTVGEVARLKAERGELKDRQSGLPIAPEQVEAVLGNLRRLTEGGIVS